MYLPDCYEADRQFDAMDRAYTAKLMKRPKCACCGLPIISETYLDLSDFGLEGFACERCVEHNTYDTEDLED